MRARPVFSTRTVGLAAALGLLALAAGALAQPFAARQASPRALRVVTLAPALSQMLVDLGRREVIVGKSEYDVSAPASAPVVGNFLEVQVERLLKLHPTHVLMMPGKEGPPRRLLEIAQKQGFVVHTYAYPNKIAEALRILDGDATELGSPNLGTLLADAEAAKDLRRRLTGRLSRLKAVCDSAGHRPRVLMAIGTGPLMASGSGTVLDELLTTYVGATNVAGGASVGAPTYNRESLLKLAPDVVVMLLPDAPPLESIDKDERLAELRGLPINAVKNGRVTLLRDPLLLLPSTNLPAAAATLARAVHPDLQHAIDAAMADPQAAAKAYPGPTPATAPAAKAPSVPSTSPSPAPGAATAPKDPPAPAHGPTTPR